MQQKQLSNISMTRINKYLADNQYCSRREADALIIRGKVLVNGKPAKLGDQVSEHDEVFVDGVQSEERAYYAYYKPAGVVTINAQEGEKEISDVITFPQKVYPLGRLDKESEGLIIMTNDGRMTDALLNPTRAHEKEYEVMVDKKASNELLQGLINGVRIGKVGTAKNYKTKPTKARRTAPNVIEIILTEGKNRQIRKMVGAHGYGVKRLKRFRILNIRINNLKANQLRRIDGKEKALLLQHLGLN